MESSSNCVESWGSSASSLFSGSEVLINDNSCAQSSSVGPASSGLLNLLLLLPNTSASVLLHPALRFARRGFSLVGVCK